MTDDQFRVLFKLRQIPQRKDHFMVLHGDDIALAEGLVWLELVVTEHFEEGDLRGYRLHQRGRQRLVKEWEARGRPKLADVENTCSQKPLPKR